MLGFIYKTTVVYIVCGIGVALIMYLIWRAIRRYRTQQARRRAAGPLQVVTPKPNGYGDLLGVEFTVVILDLIG
ncbi:MAG: hypothetical protein WBO92_02470, partial [Candidatus Moraniibacteriota bacterium]